MSIVLLGSTSGSCTLQEQAIAGTTTLTLPTTSGTVLTTGSSGQSIPKAALPTGSVLQVVQATTVSTSSTGSGTAVTTGFSASITPTSSTSKILILLSACMDSNVTNGQPNLTVYRGSTNLANTGGNQMSLSTTYGASSRIITNNSVSYLDSPATTSSTTYTVYFFNTGSAATIIFNAPNANNTNTATLTLMEIAA